MSAESHGCEVVVTRSGVHAMRDRATGELMHPVIGPRIEAERLYVAPSRLAERLSDRGAYGRGELNAPPSRLVERLSDHGSDGRGEGTPAAEAPSAAPDLVLFDVGLGAGSNAIAAWKASEGAPRTARRLAIVSFERDLAAFELALTGEHAAAFGFDGAALEAGRAVPRGRHETARTAWHLVTGDLEETLAAQPEASADVVFWDPFSPRANPSLWTFATFATLRARCRGGATVHTYSASTSVRSALLLAGFAVGVGDATGAKEQTTIAAVHPGDLRRPLDRRWLTRLARSSAPGPSTRPRTRPRVSAALQFAGDGDGMGEP